MRAVHVLGPSRTVCRWFVVQMAMNRRTRQRYHHRLDPALRSAICAGCRRVRGPDRRPCAGASDDEAGTFHRGYAGGPGRAHPISLDIGLE